MERLELEGHKCDLGSVERQGLGDRDHWMFLDRDCKHFNLGSCRLKCRDYDPGGVGRRELKDQKSEVLGVGMWRLKRQDYDVSGLGR